MHDMTTTITDLKQLVAQFIAERDWQQFHSPQNLSMNLSIEAAELMEKFLWMNAQESHQAVDTNRQDIEDELADVVMSVLAFCNVSKIDITSALQKKLVSTALKYPIDKAKGCRKKYTQL